MTPFNARIERLVLAAGLGQLQVSQILYQNEWAELVLFLGSLTTDAAPGGREVTILCNQSDSTVWAVSWTFAPGALSSASFHLSQQGSAEYAVGTASFLGKGPYYFPPSSTFELRIGGGFGAGDHFTTVSLVVRPFSIIRGMSVA